MSEDHRAIKVYCDGAMDYDKNNTGGLGFRIDFPEEYELESIVTFLNNDGFGIHQQEMISILESMDYIIKYFNNNSLRRCSFGVSIFTDRYSVPELLNPFRIFNYRKNKWKNDEEKPIKDSHLIDRIDKTRNKLSQLVGGRVEVFYKPRTQNKISDKLAKQGKKSNIKSRKIVLKKNKRITKRLFNGREVNYNILKIDKPINVRVYSWEPVNDMFEITAEFFKSDFVGSKIKIYVKKEQKDELHRSHFYRLNIEKINRHHILINKIEEILNQD